MLNIYMPPKTVCHPEHANRQGKLVYCTSNSLDSTTAPRWFYSRALHHAGRRETLEGLAADVVAHLLPSVVVVPRQGGQGLTAGLEETGDAQAGAIKLTHNPWRCMVGDGDEICC